MNTKEKNKSKICLAPIDNQNHSITRRVFLEKAGKVSMVLAGAGILGSLNVSCGGGGGGSSSPASGVENNTVYLVENGSYSENIEALFDLMGGGKDIHRRV